MDHSNSLEELRNLIEKIKQLEAENETLKHNTAQTIPPEYRLPFTSKADENKKLDIKLSPGVTNTESSEKFHSRDEEKSTEKLPTPIVTFKKRPGTSNHGTEFEQLMCGLYALKLIARNDVDDFEITSNNDEHDNFDDIGLKVSLKNGTTKKFLIQLKHKQNEKSLKVEDFQPKIMKPGPFSVEKYFTSVSNTKNHFMCILYTNAQANIQTNTKLSDGTIVQSFDVTENEDLLLNMDKARPNSIFKFTRDDQEFFLFSGQNDLHKVKKAIKRNLQNLVQCDIYNSFIQYISGWWSKNYILTKEDFISKVAELTLAPHALALTPNKCNNKTSYLQKAMMEFQTTIITQSENIIENIWNVEFASHEATTEISNKLVIDAYDQAKILWHLGYRPFVVKVNESNKITIKSVLKLLQTCTGKKKIVLLGNVTKDEFEEVDAFENLHDLYQNENCKNIYEKIVKNFNVSLQGRGKISLEQLLAIDGDIAKIVTTKELLEMSQVNRLIIGKLAEELPELHIPRTVTVNVFETRALLQHLKQTKDIIIVNCKHDFKEKHCQSSLTPFLELSDYLTSSNSNTLQHTILLSADSMCTNDQFKEISERFNKSNVYLFEEYDENRCILLKHEGKSLLLNSIQIPIEEGNIFDQLKNLLNVVCAQPGMGKSRLAKVLSHSCPPDCWVIHVNLIDQNLFFTTKPTYEDIEMRLLGSEAAEENVFCKKLQRILRKNKKVKFIFDGLDELDSKYINEMMKFVEKLLSENIAVWIASRENLREIISHALTPVFVQIKELDQEQQEGYIQTKLEKKYTPENIDEIITAIFKNADLNMSQMLLGIPLQLHIITEMFLNDKQAYKNLQQKNIFALTHMYRSFFEGKIEAAKRKVFEDGKSSQLPNQKHFLKLYQVPALMVCLDKQDFDKLELELHEWNGFSNEIKSDGDKYGIIKVVNDNDVVIFVHQTYAEYFACIWLRENRKKARLLRDVIFSKSYENMRLMLDVMMAEDNPLHLAVIYKNPEMINRHIDDVNLEDKGGRTVMHLACTYGNRISQFSEEREPEWYISLIKIIVQKGVDVNKTDTLFLLNCVQYSLKTRCLYPIETFLEKKLIDLEEAQPLISDSCNIKDLALWAARFGYSHLLSAVIDVTLSISDEEDKYNLLISAISGCESDENLITRQGNMAAVNLLLNKGVDVNGIENEYVETALDCATKKARYDMFKILLERGAICSGGDTIVHRIIKYNLKEAQISDYFEWEKDVNTRNESGATALHYACQSGNIQNVKQLLDKGADPNIVDNERKNCLMYAAQSESPNIEIINYLLIDSNCDVNAKNKSGETALQYACRSRVIENVKQLLKNEADANYMDNKGNNCLMLVLQHCDPDVEMVNELTDLISDINARNQSGATALHYACQSGDIQNVKHLLKKGADVTFVDNESKNCLMYAAQSESLNIEIINYLLIDLNCDVNAKNKVGATALHYACKAGNLQNVKQLLEKGADSNLLDNEGNNCLMYAAQSRLPNVETIDYLIGSNNFDINARNKLGTTALHLACKKGYLKIVRKLIEKGARIDCVDNDGNNLLHYGVRSDNWSFNELVNILTGRGFEVNATNNLKQTPLHLAIKLRKNNNVVSLLEKRADPNIFDINGNSAMRLAERLRHRNDGEGIIHLLKMYINNN